MWQQLLHNKYIKNKTLAQIVAKPNNSPFWKGLMRVKHEFFKRAVFKVGNGETVRFCEHTWLGESPLQYSSLYNIIQQKNVLVSTVLEQTPLNIAFRRTLNEYKYNLFTLMSASYVYSTI
jgi:hypothetical protein